jgi:CrcB protein
MKSFLFVFLGGGLGSCLRFYFSTLVNSSTIKWIPTLGVNILGCLLLGGIIAAFHKEQLSQSWLLFIGVGFCGGLTTFSTFSIEFFMLLKMGAYQTALLYLGLSLVAAIIAAGTSYWIVDKLLG